MLKKGMLLLYLVVAPSLVQALPGETLSARLVKFLQECFQAVVFKQVTALVQANPQPAAKLEQSSA